MTAQLGYTQGQTGLAAASTQSSGNQPVGGNRVREAAGQVPLYGTVSDNGTPTLITTNGAGQTVATVVGGTNGDPAMYPRTVDDFSSTATWSSSSAGVPVLATATDPKFGNVLSITTDGTTNNHDVVRVLQGRFDQGQILSLAVLPASPITVFHIDLSVRDETFAKYVTLLDDSVPGSGGGSIANYFYGSWKTMAFSASNAVGFTGGATASDLVDVRAIRIRVKTGSAAVGVCKVGGLQMTKDTSGLRVIWSFDDARDNQFTRAYPILAAQGYTGTIAMPFADLGQTLAAYNNIPLMTAAQADQLYQVGWEFIGHHSLSNNGANAATIQGRIDTYLTAMTAAGYTRGKSHWAYVGGWFDMTSAAQMLRQFISCRRVPSNGQDKWPKRKFFEPTQVGGMYLTQSVTLATAKAQFDAIKAQGNGLVMFVNHNILPSYTAEAEDWLDSDYANLVAYAKSLGFRGSSFDAEFGTLY